ncbi:MAG TPA: replication-relaxation family protein [Candidatus Limnocylindrales bacterium]|nr:replication-relaxation family protein [Candidatus Limnocylindrales bacterium]
MIPNITNKQQEITTLIPRYRFLNRQHIQSLLNHKDEARINNWLKDLTEKKYIKRIYDNTIIGKNRISAIYTLDNNGIRYIKAKGKYDTNFIHKLYWDKTRSDSFIQHCLLISRICCELERKNNDTVTRTYSTESDICNEDSDFKFLKNSDLSVDICFSKKEKGKKIQYFLLTIFDEKLPYYRIRKRIRAYKDFYYSNEWENHINSPFPMIFFVGGTKERMIYAKRYTKRILEEDNTDELSIMFATAEDVIANGVTGSIWESIK